MYRLYDNKEKTGFYILLLPSLIGISIFFIIPYVLMFFYTFSHEGTVITQYLNILNNSVFQLASRNTFIFTAVSVPLITILSMLLAISLNRNIYFRDQLRSSFIYPLILPISSVIIFFDLFFDLNGVLNHLMQFIGIEPINWMNSQYAMVTIIAIYIWKNIGYNMIIFLAGLQSIPMTYYEVALLDGASKYQVFKNITFIYLIPTTYFVFIISIINSFKVFKEVYILTGSYPHQSIYMLQHYMNNLFSKLEYSKLTIVAIIASFVIGILVWILFLIQKKIMEAIN